MTDSFGQRLKHFVRFLRRRNLTLHLCALVVVGLLWCSQSLAAVATRINGHTREITVGVNFTNNGVNREVITAADVRMFKLHGFNHFRVLIPLRLAMPRYAASADIEVLHKTLASDLAVWLGEDMAVSLTPIGDLNDIADLLSTPSGRADFASFWTDLAGRYAHLSTELLSFEILNEPTAVTGSVASDCAFPACSPPVWRDYQAAFIQAIRTAAPNHTILVSAADFNNFPALIQFTPYADTNLIYAVHYYPAQVFVAQSAWRTEYGLRYPACLPGAQDVVNGISNPQDHTQAQQYVNDNWRRARILQDLSQVANWAALNGVQVFVNELAAYSMDMESRTRWVRDVRLVLDSFNIPWSVWSTADYYTRGWVPNDRLPFVDLLRGTNSMPWNLPEPACTGEVTSQVDLAVAMQPSVANLQISVSNTGPDTAHNVEVRIGLAPGLTVTQAIPNSGSCSVSKDIVICHLGLLAAGSTNNLQLVTSASDHTAVATQIIVVSDGREMDETNNFAVSAMQDTDGDGIGDNSDADDDNDGMLDEYEAEWGLARANAADQLVDPDKDGYSNLSEAQGGTINPQARFGTNPFNGSSTPETGGATLAAAVVLIGPSRQNGPSITMFANLTNTGTGTAANCSVVPKSAPSTMSYKFYPMDSLTKAVDGPAFQRRTIPGGGSQSFVLVFEGNSAIAPTMVTLRFDCENTAPTLLDTLLDLDGPISVICPSAPLQAAINLASPGSAISVSGVCDENLIIRNEKQRITIDGSGAGPGTRATINGTGNSAGFNVRGKGILIQNFTIAGGSNGVHVNRGSNAVLNNNVIQNAAGNGVLVDELAFVVLTNNTIQNNPAAGVFLSENATARIGFNADSETVASANMITNNAVGILVSNNSSARVIGNTIQNNTGDGIQVLRDSHADIASNAINSNGGDGIVIEENSFVQLGEDSGTSIYESPNTSTGTNTGFGIRCANGGAADGRIGSLTGGGGAKSFVDASCMDSLSM